jgi:adenylate cyclase
MALSIAGVIEPTLQAAEMRYAVDLPTNDLTAYDLYLRARSVASTYEREDFARALDLLGQAITREPRYGAALALAATYRVDLENYDWVNDREAEENRRTAIDFAREALGAAADDPGVLGQPP